MTVPLKSALASVMIACAVIQVLTMFEVMGRERPRGNPRVLGWIHRGSGYGFVVLLVTISVFCVKDFVTSTAEISTRGLFHSVLALIVILVLAIKLGVLRRYHLFGKFLPLLGGSVFVLSFVVYALSGGYFYLVTAAHNNRSLAYFYGKLSVDAKQGEGLVEYKCSMCLTLERIFVQTKTREGWMETVARMRERLPGWINDNDARTISGFLAEVQGPKAAEAGVADASAGARTLKKKATAVGNSIERIAAGKQVFDSRCGFCHNVAEVEDKVGPGLKNLFSRGTLPYSGKPVTEENIRAQLRNPAQNMPAQTDLAADQVDTLLAYLHTI
jgi:cytochrome c2